MDISRSFWVEAFNRNTTPTILRHLLLLREITVEDWFLHWWGSFNLTSKQVTASPMYMAIWTKPSMWDCPTALESPGKEIRYMDPNRLLVTRLGQRTSNLVAMPRL
jgi:hypothetical protein